MGYHSASPLNDTNWGVVRNGRLEVMWCRKNEAIAVARLNAGAKIVQLDPRDKRKAPRLAGGPPFFR